MHILNLSLRHFRNYEQLEFTPGPGVSLIYGNNASGKTSLLEALFYLATTRSPRTTNDRELVNWHAREEAVAPPFARIAADVQQVSGYIKIEVLIQLRSQEQHENSGGGSQKLVRLNQRVVRALDLIGQLRVVLFTPDDLTLVDGAPSNRRRYLDMTLSQLDPHYVRTLSRYNKLVQTRNAMLRAWRERRRTLRSVDEELAYWDDEMITAGGYVLAERLQAVADVNTLIKPIFQANTGEAQELHIAYRPSFDFAGMTEAHHLVEQFRQTLQQRRSEELKRGQTLVGPQRDDLLFTVGNVDLGRYGSRGQQRSVALALKLAEVELMRMRSGDAPILLLDDVLSELDLQRRKYTLEAIRHPHQQTIVSSTDLGTFDGDFLSAVDRWRVEQGRVYRG
ncbi:MAG: DNA replication/repair protein RecF [Chloroflexaceae bacterium]|nr:DNA replication/repair protein RecF [Chloroflexaceae bacterium]